MAVFVVPRPSAAGPRYEIRHAWVIVVHMYRLSRGLLVVCKSDAVASAAYSMRYAVCQAE